MISQHSFTNICRFIHHLFLFLDHMNYFKMNKNDKNDKSRRFSLDIISSCQSFPSCFLSLVLWVWDEVGTVVPGRLSIRLESSALLRHTHTEDCLRICHSAFQSHRRMMVCWTAHTLWQFTLNLILRKFRKENPKLLFTFALPLKSLGSLRFFLTVLNIDNNKKCFLSSKSAY